MKWLSNEWSVDDTKLKYGEYYLLYPSSKQAYEIGRFFDSDPKCKDVIYSSPGFYCYMEKDESYHLCTSNPMVWIKIENPFDEFFNEYAEKPEESIWKISVDERCIEIFEPITQAFITADDVITYTFFIVKDIDESYCEYIIDKNNENDPTELIITYTKNGAIALKVKAVKLK